MWIAILIVIILLLLAEDIRPADYVPAGAIPTGSCCGSIAMPTGATMERSWPRKTRSLPTRRPSAGLRRGTGCASDAGRESGRYPRCKPLRTAGADVLVEDLTARELKAYRLEGTDEEIPLLEEVLPLFEQSGLPLVVELKAERGNHDALAAATCAMLDKYKVLYCIESFDPRCIRWLKRNRPEIVRGQLSENFLRHGDGGDMPKALLWALGNLLTNCLAKPDFIAYRFSDRDKFLPALVPVVLSCPGDQLDPLSQKRRCARRSLPEIW